MVLGSHNGPRCMQAKSKMAGRSSHARLVYTTEDDDEGKEEDVLVFALGFVNNPWT